MIEKRKSSSRRKPGSTVPQAVPLTGGSRLSPGRRFLNLPLPLVYKITAPRCLTASLSNLIWSRFQRLQRAQVIDDRVDVVGGHVEVVGGRHGSRQISPVGPLPDQDRALDVGIAPLADPGFRVG